MALSLLFPLFIIIWHHPLFLYHGVIFLLLLLLFLLLSWRHLSLTPSSFYFYPMASSFSYSFFFFFFPMALSFSYSFFFLFFTPIFFLWCHIFSLFPLRLLHFSFFTYGALFKIPHFINFTLFLFYFYFLLPMAPSLKYPTL